MRNSFLLALCIIGTVATFSACSEEKKNTTDENYCDHTTYTATCKGEYDKLTCTDDDTITSYHCENGCKNGACVDSSTSNCGLGNINWTCTDSKHSDGCAMNAPQTFECVNECDESTGKCACPSDCSKCDYYGNCTDVQTTCDETACLLGCNEDGSCIEEGTEDICAYRCKDDKFIGCFYQEDQAERILLCYDGESCNVDEKGCVSKAENECTNGETKCATSDEPSTNLVENEELIIVCQDGHWVRSINNLCDIGQICSEGKCITDPSTLTCKPGCNHNVELTTCTDDDKEVVITCDYRCDEATLSCADNTCDSATFKTDCRTATEKLICSNGKMVGEACPADKPMCVQGECYAATKPSTSTCTDEGITCSDDQTSLVICEDGVQTSKSCGSGNYCKEGEDGEDATCEKTMWTTSEGTFCDSDHFVPFCDDGPTAKNCVQDSSDNQYYVVETHCSKSQTCTVSGEAKCDNSQWYMTANVGDKCTDARKGTYFCKNDIPMWCNEKGIISTVKDDATQCSASGMFCDTITDSNSVTTSGCFESCDLANQTIRMCDSYDGGAYSSVFDVKCVTLGSGKLGLDRDNSSNYEFCDFGCKEGECVDYTADIEKIGEECDTSSFKGYCTSTSPLFAVSCDATTDGSFIISAEKCYLDEQCLTNGYKAWCGKTNACKEGDTQYTCSALLGIEYKVKQTCTLLEDGNYDFVSADLGDDWVQCSNGCSDGKCL